MGLFDQILGAIDDPNQQASPDQLSNSLNTVQQAAETHGVPTAATTDVMSVLGGYVRSALQQHEATNGQGSAATLVNQFGGTNPSAAAMQTLFNPTQQQEVAQAIAQRTGVSASAIMGMLPILVPIVLNLLKSGASAHGSAAQSAPAGSNPVLNSFLDANGDGNVDIGDAMSMAGRYLSQR